jgi:ribosomal protein S17E
LEKKKGLGKVRPDYLKKLARKLVERFQRGSIQILKTTKEWWLL